MARLFDAGSTEYLGIAQALVSGEPFTMACWFYGPINNWQCLMSLADKDVTNKQHRLALTDATGIVEASTFDGTLSDANSSAGVGANAWHHVCGVWAATNDRRAFLDGGNKGTNTATRNVTGIDNFTIGVTADSTPLGWCNGRIAETTVWNVALTDDEVAILAARFSSLFVRPQSLVSYWLLIRDEDQDRVGGYDLTAYNTPSIASHPPIIYPAPSIFYSVPAAARRIFITHA